MKNKPLYYFFYYAMHTTTGEVKFFVYDWSKTFHPQTSVKYHRLNQLKRTFVNRKSPWRILTTGYALEHDIKSLKSHQPQTPRINDNSLIYASSINSR